MSNKDYEDLPIIEDCGWLMVEENSHEGRDRRSLYTFQSRVDFVGYVVPGLEDLLPYDMPQQRIVFVMVSERDANQKTLPKYVYYPPNKCSHLYERRKAVAVRMRKRIGDSKNAEQTEENNQYHPWTDEECPADTEVDYWRMRYRESRQEAHQLAEAVMNMTDISGDTSYVDIFHRIAIAVDLARDIEGKD